VESYGVDREGEQIDYDAVAAQAKACKPKIIVAGASAYPRALDFERFRAIADSVGAYLMVDMAHIAGLVAGDCHADPVPVADFVTSTTHKTLRGPRSGLVLCRGEYGPQIDKQVFPGLQGGPEAHTIAAKAVCFQEALQPAFREYAQQIVRNAQVMAEALQKADLRLVSGGTDNHLMLVDVTTLGLTGKDAANALESAGIVLNKNCIPFDTKSPFVTSGIRVGTAAATTRGMKEDEMTAIAGMMMRVLRDPADEKLQESTAAEVRELCRQFPVP
jgi:glycine hydroxymethyltransferase